MRYIKQLIIFVFLLVLSMTLASTVSAANVTGNAQVYYKSSDANNKAAFLSLDVFDEDGFGTIVASVEEPGNGGVGVSIIGCIDQTSCSVEILLEEEDMAKVCTDDSFSNNNVIVTFFDSNGDQTAFILNKTNGFYFNTNGEEIDKSDFDVLSVSDVCGADLYGKALNFDQIAEELSQESEEKLDDTNELYNSLSDEEKNNDFYQMLFLEDLEELQKEVYDLANDDEVSELKTAVSGSIIESSVLETENMLNSLIQEIEDLQKTIEGSENFVCLMMENELVVCTKLSALKLEILSAVELIDDGLFVLQAEVTALLNQENPSFEQAKSFHTQIEELESYAEEVFNSLDETYDLLDDQIPMVPSDLDDYNQLKKILDDFKEDLDDLEDELEGLDDQLEEEFGEFDEEEDEFNEDPLLGKNDAPVTIVMFGGFEEPFSGKFVNDTLPQIYTTYILNGSVNLVFKNFPLSFHPNAQISAEAGECVFEEEGDQGFWEMFSVMYANQNALTEEDLIQYADYLDIIDVDDFTDCLQDHDMNDEVADDVEDGEELGVAGSPYFFINGKVIAGAQSFEVFQQIINQELENADKPEEPTSEFKALKIDSIIVNPNSVEAGNTFAVTVALKNENQKFNFNDVKVIVSNSAKGFNQVVFLDVSAETIVQTNELFFTVVDTTNTCDAGEIIMNVAVETEADIDPTPQTVTVTVTDNDTVCSTSNPTNTTNTTTTKTLQQQMNDLENKYNDLDDTYDDLDSDVEDVLDDLTEAEAEDDKDDIDDAEDDLDDLEDDLDDLEEDLDVLEDDLKDFEDKVDDDTNLTKTERDNLEDDINDLEDDIDDLNNEIDDLKQVIKQKGQEEKDNNDDDYLTNLNNVDEQISPVTVETKEQQQPVQVVDKTPIIIPAPFKTSPVINQDATPVQASFTDNPVNIALIVGAAVILLGLLTFSIALVATRKP